MRIRHPSDNCLNCNYKISRRTNYCPNCGQENTDYKYAIWHLLYESINNYLNIDSQFFRSIFPFLFSPGHLTIKFIEGRRKLFINPVRLYLIVSIIFFFFFSQILDLDETKINIVNEKELDKLFKSEVLDKSQDLKKLLKGFPEEELLSTNIALDSIPRYITKESKVQLLSQSLDTASLDELTFLGVDYKFNTQKAYHIWMRQPDMTADIFLDSLGATEKNFFNRKVADQLLRVGQTSNFKVIVNSVIENISIMFFILIPFFALLLKIFYLRHKKLYYNHLIYSFHLHTYLFFIAAVCIVISYFYKSNSTILVYGLCIFILYVLFMARRVYKQGWLKTIFKTFLLFNVYFILILLFSILEVLASILTF